MLKSLQKSRAGVQFPQGLCDASRVSGPLQFGNAHRLAANKLQDHDVVFRQVIEHSRTHAGLASRSCVVVFVGTVDGEQFRRRAGDADDMRRAVDPHQVVRVRQSAG